MFVQDAKKVLPSRFASRLIRLFFSPLEDMWWRMLVAPGSACARAEENSASCTNSFLLVVHFLHSLWFLWFLWFPALCLLVGILQEDHGLAHAQRVRGDPFLPPVFCCSVAPLGVFSSALLRSLLHCAGCHWPCSMQAIYEIQQGGITDPTEWIRPVSSFHRSVEKPFRSSDLPFRLPPFYLLPFGLLK